MSEPERRAVLTTSHEEERCDECAGAIPAWEPYVNSWQGQADAQRVDHAGCAPLSPTMTMPGLTIFGAAWIAGGLAMAERLSAMGEIQP